jgi:hypothetical protein
MPSPAPAVKLKRLKSDCAEADAMSPQKASKKSIRFLNLDLLFPGSDVLHLDAHAENESQPFSRPSIAPGGRPGRVADLRQQNRPVLAEHVSTRAACQIQTITKQSISDGAVPVRPVYVRQSLGHQRTA